MNQNSKLQAITWSLWKGGAKLCRSKPWIDQFRYIKIQPKTIDFSTRLWEINTEFLGFIPQSLKLRSIVLDWILIYRNWSIVLVLLLIGWHRDRGARRKVGGLTIENNFFILKIEKRNKIIVFYWGGGTKKWWGRNPTSPTPSTVSVTKWGKF